MDQLVKNFNKVNYFSVKNNAIVGAKVDISTLLTNSMTKDNETFLAAGSNHASDLIYVIFEDVRSYFPKNLNAFIPHTF